MKYFFMLCSLFSVLLLSPTTLASDVINTKPETSETMPRSFTEWEEKNKVREDKEESVYGELWSKTLLLLIAILAFLFIATWFMKRFDAFKVKPQVKESQIHLLERKVLSPKSVLYLIEIEGQKIALAESATNGVQLLHTLVKSVTDNDLRQKSQQ